MLSSIYLKAIILAILEGLTEFIPVSSTGHMIILGHWIEFTGKKADTFEIFIQLGAILAVLIIYSDVFINLIQFRDIKKNPIKKLLLSDKHPNNLHIIFAISPALIMGFLLYSLIKEHLFSPFTVSLGLIIGGILMIIIEYLPIKKNINSIEKISYKQAFLIGVGQCLALWPGMSRSGSTMITSLILGIKHRPAADFSFIIAVPVMFAAVGYDLLKSWKYLELSDLGYFAVGFGVSFIVAWLAVKWFLKILTKTKLIPFGVYRIILGAIVISLI
jgi:undecaprenyl-diphosphatase